MEKIDRETLLNMAIDLMAGKEIEIIYLQDVENFAKEELTKIKNKEYVATENLLSEEKIRDIMCNDKNVDMTQCGLCDHVIDCNNKINRLRSKVKEGITTGPRQ